MEQLTVRSIGKRTTFSFAPTARTSLMIVSITGSSSVDKGAKNSDSSCPAELDCMTAVFDWFIPASGFAHWGPPPGFIAAIARRLTVLLVHSVNKNRNACKMLPSFVSAIVQCLELILSANALSLVVSFDWHALANYVVISLFCSLNSNSHAHFSNSIPRSP